MRATGGDRRQAGGGRRSGRPAARGGDGRRRGRSAGRDRLVRVRVRAGAVPVGPRVDDRRDTGRPARGVVRGHGGRTPGRRHLGVAKRRGRLVPAGRSGERPAVRRDASPLLEPRALPAVARAAAALLQGRAQPARVVGPRAHVRRPGAVVVGPDPAAGRDPRPDPRQARRAGRRRGAGRIEHRARRLGGAHGALDGRRPGVGRRVAEERAAQRPEGVRGDPADDPRALALTAAGALPQPPGGRHRGLVRGCRPHLGPDGRDGPAEPERRHRRAAALGRPLPARLQPDEERPRPARDRGLGRRQGLGPRRRPGGLAGRVLLPRDDPGPRRPGARHLHVEARADPARGRRPGEDPASAIRVATLVLADYNPGMAETWVAVAVGVGQRGPGLGHRPVERPRGNDTAPRRDARVLPRVPDARQLDPGPAREVVAAGARRGRAAAERAALRGRRRGRALAPRAAARRPPEGPSRGRAWRGGPGRAAAAEPAAVALRAARLRRRGPRPRPGARGDPDRPAGARPAAVLSLPLSGRGRAGGQRGLGPGRWPSRGAAGRGGVRARRVGGAARSARGREGARRGLRPASRAARERRRRAQERAGPGRRIAPACAR